MLDENVMNAIVEQAKDSISKSVIEELSRNALWQAKQELANQMAREIQEFFETEIKDELVAAMRAEKEAIIACAVAAQVEISKVLVESMVSTVTKNLSGYNGNKILKALFD